ncbi:MAG: hypothetical protein KGO96_08600 [Elusimicrobia bacterium]|nr:hypothetical protein [Elusimicrobiota bacterium]MDE2425949.1 hypothetical protein [Elusimicrobiota bacterium]
MKLKPVLSRILSGAVLAASVGPSATRAFAEVVAGPAAPALIKALPSIQADPGLWNDDVERVLGQLRLDSAVGRGEEAAGELLGNAPAARFGALSPENQSNLLRANLDRLRRELDPRAEELLRAAASAPLTPEQQRGILRLDAKFYLLSPELAERFHRQAAQVQWDLGQEELRAIVSDAMRFTRARASQEMIAASRRGIIEGAEAAGLKEDVAGGQLEAYASRAFQQAAKRLEERGLHGGLLSVEMLEKHRRLAASASQTRHMEPADDGGGARALRGGHALVRFGQRGAGL